MNGQEGITVRFLRRTKLSKEQQIANAVNNCVTSLIERYKNTPVKVQHTVTHKPRPRPNLIWIVFRTESGREFRTIAFPAGNGYSHRDQVHLGALTEMAPEYVNLNIQYEVFMEFPDERLNQW